jgi:hypothetical protein
MQQTNGAHLQANAGSVSIFNSLPLLALLCTSSAPGPPEAPSSPTLQARLVLLLQHQTIHSVTSHGKITAWMEAIMDYAACYSGINQEILKKTTKIYGETAVWKEAIIEYPFYSPGIRLEILKKTAKN